MSWRSFNFQSLVSLAANARTKLGENWLNVEKKVHGSFKNIISMMRHKISNYKETTPFLHKQGLQQDRALTLLAKVSKISEHVLECKWEIMMKKKIFYVMDCLRHGVS